MNRVRLIHWNANEAQAKAKTLQASGFDVDYEPITPRTLRELKNAPPTVVVIDLTRLPMQGRDIAFAIRHYKTTRQILIIFVDGNPEKIAKIKKQLPDATYTTWPQIHSSIQQAITQPKKVTIIPRSLLEGYSGRPLAKKLGIKPDSVVTLINAPQQFKKSLGELPKDVKLLTKASNRTDLTVWFIRSKKELHKNIETMSSLAQNGGLWIAWPKKTSKIASDLTQTTVREAGLAAGLVDYKVCSINATWSGLLFTQRKPS